MHHVHLPAVEGLWRYIQRLSDGRRVQPSSCTVLLPAGVPKVVLSRLINTVNMLLSAAAALLVWLVVFTLVMLTPRVVLVPAGLSIWTAVVIPDDVTARRDRR